MVKIKISIRFLLALFALMPMLWGCKPTEKGYQQAYDAAKSKREQKDPDEALLTGGHRLLTDEAINWRVVDGDSLQVEHKFLKPTDGESWPQNGAYRLAVAMMKMTTNAKSMLADLKKKDTLKPVIATDGKDNYYIIAGSAPYLDSLSVVLSTFKRENPGFRYIGLPQEKPLVIVGR